MLGRSTVKRLSFNTWCLLALGLVATGSAAHSEAQSSESFGETIKHAVTEYDSGNWAEAHTLFAQAHELNPNARTWRGLGLASFEMRHYLSAIEELSAALSDPRKPLSSAQRREVEGVLSRAQQFVAVYQIKLDPPDAELRVENRVVQLEGGQLRLDPGDYVLVARALGYQEYRTNLRAEAGDRGELVMALMSHELVAPRRADASKPPPAAPAPPVTPPPPQRASANMLWAGGVTLALGLGAESWAWYAFRVRVSRANTLVDAPEDDYEGERQAWVDARAPLLAATIMGTALTTVGVELMVLGAPNERLPWWVAGVSAAVGTGLATWGLVDIVRGACSSDDVRACAWQSQRRERGTIVLLTSTPLFGIPITKLARSAGSRPDRTQLGLTVTSGGLAMNGRW
jgi:hypothetical protein